MSFAEHTRALLARRGAPRAAELRQRLDQLQALHIEHRRTAQRIGVSDRLLFFSSTADEQLEDQYEEAIATAEAAHQQALTAWCEAMQAASSQYPPLEMVYRMAHAIHDADAVDEIGRESKASEAMAERLEEIAERLLALWAPGVPIAQVAGWLADDAARREAAAVDLGPLREHPTLGWAPIDARELSIRVACTLVASGSFQRSKATLERESYELDAVIEQLRLARERVSWTDKVVPGKSAEQRAVAQLEQQQSKELLEVAWALEQHHLEVVRAFAVHPVIWLHIALLGAATCLRSVAPQQEVVLGGDGEIRKTRDRAGRAVFFACLVEVRRAAEHAFPGVFELVWPRSDAPANAIDWERGPYRQRGPVAAEPAEAAPHHPDDDYFAALERAQLRDTMSRAVTAATMIALLERGRSGAEETIALTDRLAFWSNTDAEQTRDALAKRTQRLRDSLRSQVNAARACATNLAVEHPALGVGTALALMSGAVEEIRTSGGESSSPRHCPVLNQQQTQQIIASGREVLSRLYDVRGNRRSWVEAVLQRLPTPGQQEQPTVDGRLSYGGIIERLAAQLRPTPFASLWASVSDLQQRNAQAEHMVRQTKEAVPWLDVLNIFDTSEAEQVRDQWKDYSKEVRDQLRSSQPQLNGLLQRALESYPPLLLDEHLATALRLVGEVSAHSERRTRTHETRDSKGRVTSRRTETYYVCVLVGASAAIAAVDAATRYAATRFAAFPTATQMLQAWVQQEL